MGSILMVGVQGLPSTRRFAASLRINFSSLQLLLTSNLFDINFTGRGAGTRTLDLSVPNAARYQLRYTPIFTKVIVQGKLSDLLVFERISTRVALEIRQRVT